MLFSVYPCHTKSPLDESCICEVNYNKLINNSISRPKHYYVNKRVTGLFKNENLILANIGVNIASFNNKLVTNLFSSRYFNQVHSIYADNEHIYVTSTGLDLLLVFDYKGNLIRSWHPKYGKDYLPEYRDYRLLNSNSLGTNIYHLNHVFIYDNNIYVSCGKSKTYHILSGCLTELEKIPCKNFGEADIIHDGIILNNKLHFTQTSGHIHIINLNDMSEECIDIKHRWIRGLKYSNNKFYIGTSATDKPYPSIIELNENFTITKNVKFNIQLSKNNSINLQPQIYSII